jgi:hypothetical protein
VPLDIVLKGDFVSRAIITRHLLAIGDTYSEKWSYDPSRAAKQKFLLLRGECVVPTALVQDLGYGAERIEMSTLGVLLPGLWHGDHGDEVGFHASIFSDTRFLVSKHRHPDDAWDIVKLYPCSHVPVPPDW